MKDHADTTPTGRPLIIPFFIPHLGCPHQCVFCNQRSITGERSRPPSVSRINEAVQRYLKYAKKRYASIQISFFGGNFLGLDKTLMHRLLAAATAFVDRGEVDSLRFSTRPDTICEETLAAIAPYPVNTVELGVQSMNDAVLSAAGRGHLSADTVAATNRLQAGGYQVGLQMMVGLPGDDDAGAMQSARQIAALAPDFVRIYPTLVLAGSPLARLFRTGAYRPMSLDRCVTLVKRLFLLFRSRGIPVVRMGLQASDGLTDDRTLLAGPYHPAFGHLVHGEIVLDAIRGALGGMDAPPRHLSIVTHPAMVSRVQGLNKRNLHYLQDNCSLEAITIVQDETIPTGQLRVGDHCITFDI